MRKAFLVRLKALEDGALRGPGARGVRQARLREAACEPFYQTAITLEMLEDPVNGEAWRKILEAQQRESGFTPALSPALHEFGLYLQEHTRQNL